MILAQDGLDFYRVRGLESPLRPFYLTGNPPQPTWEVALAAVAIGLGVLVGV